MKRHIDKAGICMCPEIRYDEVKKKLSSLEKCGTMLNWHVSLIDNLVFADAAKMLVTTAY